MTSPDSAALPFPAPPADSRRTRFLEELTGAMRATADAERAAALALLAADVEAATARIQALATARIALVMRSADAYREDLEAFGRRLATIEDPATLAAAVSAIPAAPDLLGLVDGEVPDVGLPQDRTGDLGLAESEAASVVEDTPALAHLVPRAEPAPVVDASVITTRVLVEGLRSLAGIAAFKQSLARRPGIQSLAVTGNDDGTFVFRVVHRGSVDVEATIASLRQFGPDGQGAPATERDAEGTVRVAVDDAEAGSAA